MPSATASSSIFFFFPPPLFSLFFFFRSKVPQTNFVLQSGGSERWDFKVTRAGPAPKLSCGGGGGARPAGAEGEAGPGEPSAPAGPRNPRLPPLPSPGTAAPVTFGAEFPRKTTTKSCQDTPGVWGVSRLRCSLPTPGPSRGPSRPSQGHRGSSRRARGTPEWGHRCFVRPSAALTPLPALGVARRGAPGSTGGSTPNPKAGTSRRATPLPSPGRTSIPRRRGLSPAPGPPSPAATAAAAPRTHRRPCPRPGVPRHGFVFE